MAVEAKRGCGYRKVGGIYLVAPGAGEPCDRLPIALDVCPCCGHGFKQGRGWTWVDVNLLVQGVHRGCRDGFPCPLCMATSEMGKCGMLWIGAQFYPTPAAFQVEAAALGISRRISRVPRGFRVGETWVLLSHPKTVTCPDCRGGGLAVQEMPLMNKPGAAPDPCEKCDGTGYLPGIFRVFRPHRIEKIITETMAKDNDLMNDLLSKGITAVIVPDNDRDHQGTVYDDAPPLIEGEAAEGAGK